ncbi:nucleotide-binding protein [Listeria cornellensis]|uniref:Nucleotide-binding protein n=1 Tax=Listeria cornellensis FSL F6-0969 TaxID=1265820 RepID=W7BXA2_9LIST|nr:nucleotide-binding protein [Listeria cornellensis]EUJ31459.1 nucleotide-binding protein [Listeria cornellensis FSL F6-0969]
MRELSFIFNKVKVLNTLASNVVGLDFKKYHIKENEKENDILTEPAYTRFIQHVEFLKREGERELHKYVFVIHGHSKDTVELQSILGLMGKEPITIKELDDNNMSFIDKIEKYSNVRHAVALLTPDDWGAKKECNQILMRGRARQNVIFELGYFFGKIGKANTICLVKGEVDLPSDLDGLGNIRYQDSLNEVSAKLQQLLEYK